MLTPEELDALEEHPQLWTGTLFPSYIQHPATRVPVPMGEHHLELWDFVRQIERGHLPVIRDRQRDSFIAVWPRGGAKTTTAQLACSYLAGRGTRRYGIYVSDTLEQASQKVEGIGTMLTSSRFRMAYPEVAARRINEYGKGAWRRSRIQTQEFTLDAFGMDSAIRGVKIDEDRPDLIVLDDLDKEHDSAYLTEVKMDKLRRSILPAGQQGNTITIGLQNLILLGGIFDQLVGATDVLANRLVRGPHPAVKALRTEAYVDSEGRDRTRITGGSPTWSGFSLGDAQDEIDRIGIRSFMLEMQHDLRAQSDLIYSQFSPDTHRWLATKSERGADKLTRLVPDIPKILAVFGGLDYGGEGLSAHLSAGMIGLLLTNGRILLVDEWADNGPGVGDRQRKWMYEMTEKWGVIFWGGGGDQYRENETQRTLGFDVVDSTREAGSVDRRIKAMGNLLLPPGIDPRQPPEEWSSTALPYLMYLPRRCEKWAAEMPRYRRKPPRVEDEPAKREPLQVHNDLIDASLYLVERALKWAGVQRGGSDLVLYAAVEF